MNFGRRSDPVLDFLRRTMEEARAVAKTAKEQPKQISGLSARFAADSSTLMENIFARVTLGTEEDELVPAVGDRKC